MKTMSIDLETRSSVDISKCGVYKYAESPDFDILLFGVSVDGSPIAVYDLACGDVIPNDILAALSDERVTKWAYNASFERVCLSVWLRRNYPQYFSTYSIEGDPVQNYLDPASWKCTLVWAAYNGLPLGLEKVGAVLGFEEQKLKEGKELIRFSAHPAEQLVAHGTCRSMRWTNGHCSKSTMSATCRWKCRSRSACGITLCRTPYGMSITWTSKSTTAAS